MYAHASNSLREGQTAQSASVSDSIVIKNVTMCSLSPCVRDYRLSVANGHTSAHIIKSSLGSFWPEYTNPEQRKRDEVVTIVEPYIDKVCWRPNSHTVAASGSLETNFSSCEGWMGNLGEKFDSLIPGEASTSWEWDDMLGWSQSSGWESSAALILGRILMLGFENAITRLAAALTSQSMEDSQYAVNGTAYVSDVYVSVQWPWLILPALLVLAGAVFLATTITLSRKSKLPLWKSSALASLYHGLDHTEKDEYRTASIMEKTAKMEDVQLQFSEQNGRLMLQQPKTTEAP
ncbi:hypothetical protein PENSTE_c012G06956 [Penicillium steckii]|uniref:Uncharacterized protein n=1 Tax=Penicillium steckii TaxID=303698 RepID=A0A1V6T4Q3_9EURO|nr:hypothetical protein PENSTE_c012G06956 [Penicillium steckii]